MRHADAPDPGACTILIVDDDGAFRSFLAGLLRPRDHVVLQARAAPDAWAIFERQRINLAVIGAQLNGRDGARLVEQLRGRGLNLPVILLADSWQDPEIYRRLTDELGVQRVIHKPFSAYQFIMEVGLALRPQHQSIAPAAPVDEDSESGTRRLHSDPSFPALEAASSTARAVLAAVGGDVALLDELREAAREAMVNLIPLDDAPR